MGWWCSPMVLFPFFRGESEMNTEKYVLRIWSMWISRTEQMSISPLVSILKWGSDGHWVLREHIRRDKVVHGHPIQGNVILDYKPLLLVMEILTPWKRTCMVFVWLYSDVDEFHRAVSLIESFQFLTCLGRQSERACETLHARSSTPDSIMQQYINIITTSTTSTTSTTTTTTIMQVPWRVSSPSKSFHPTWVPTGSWVLCSTVWLYQPASMSINDLKKLISGKENKKACLFSMIPILIQNVSV